MTPFRTEIRVEPTEHPIRYDSNIFLLGSCFSDHMALALQQRRFPLLSNPFGVIYNPVSIAEALRMHLNNERIAEEAVFEQAGLYRHFNFHSKCAYPEKQRAIEIMQEAVNSGHDFLFKTTHLIITFGTAYVYREMETGKVVANNHKLPAEKFTKQILSIDEIVQEWKPLIQLLNSRFPELYILFTVSPVRHLRDGMIENAQSKAVLLQSIALLQSLYPDLYYFPSFEIMMDDLRDYRFYEQDMIHPNATAIQYIWDKFRSACINADDLPLMEAIEALHAAMAHRAFFTGTEQHRQFRLRMLEKAEQLQQSHPYLDLRSYIDFFGG